MVDKSALVREGALVYILTLGLSDLTDGIVEKAFNKPEIDWAASPFLYAD